jgi:hypothetical protein
MSRSGAAADLVDRFLETNHVGSDGIQSHRPHPEEPCAAAVLLVWLWRKPVRYEIKAAALAAAALLALSTSTISRYSRSRSPSS